MKKPDIESKRWLEQAQYDLKVSQWNVGGRPDTLTVFLVEFQLMFMEDAIHMKPFGLQRR